MQNVTHNIKTRILKEEDSKLQGNFYLKGNSKELFIKNEATNQADHVFKDILHTQIPIKQAYLLKKPIINHDKETYTIKILLDKQEDRFKIFSNKSKLKGSWLVIDEEHSGSYVKAMCKMKSFMSEQKLSGKNCYIKGDCYIEDNFVKSNVHDIAARDFFWTILYLI